MPSADFLIVGGGLAGVSTLYELTVRGHRAVLVEAADSLGTGASFANGAMLTPSMPDPWNGPGVWRHLLSSVFASSSAMKLHLSQIPDLFAWGLRFLAHSAPDRHRQSTLANFLLGDTSLGVTEQLRAKLGFDDDWKDGGTLKFFESDEALSGPLATSRWLAKRGLRFAVLDADAAVAAEPQLSPIRDRIHAALHFPDDRTGDARKYLIALAGAAKALGGEIRLGARVERLVTSGRNLTGMIVDGAYLPGQVILCAGIDAPVLARQAGIHLSIKPAKGYSLTLDAASLGPDMPRLPVIDDAMHAAVVPLGDRLRLVGTAEFAGRNARVDPARIDNLVALFRRIYPHLAERLDIPGGSAWAGLRPMSADGRPFIGRSHVAGLWLNCGHGHLGWTMAAGAARIVADGIENEPNELAGLFALARSRVV